MTAVTPAAKRHRLVHFCPSGSSTVNGKIIEDRGPDKNREVMKTVENYLTVLQVLDIHADYGQLDRALVKQAMGPNWPKEWDLIPDDGSGIFEASKPLKKSPQIRFRTSGI